MVAEQGEQIDIVWAKGAQVALVPIPTLLLDEGAELDRRCDAHGHDAVRIPSEVLCANHEDVPGAHRLQDLSVVRPVIRHEDRDVTLGDQQ